MSKEATVRTRIDSDLKSEVEKLFKELGLSTTEAITLFYRQVKLRNGLPLEVVVPNEATRQTFEDTDAGKNVIRCETVDEMFSSLAL